MSELEFDKLAYESKGAYQNGKIKLQSSGLLFKNSKTNKNDQISSTDIESLSWFRRSKGYCLKVQLKKDKIHVYDGFKEDDFKKIDDFCYKNYNKHLTKTDVSVKGWNWGKTNFVGDALDFEIDGKLGFEIPLKNVSNTNAQKNEAVLQFHQNEEASISLMEIRFHIPSNENEDADTAQDFCRKVLSVADIASTDVDSICTLSELNCLTPRGRYDVKFYSDFIDLHGKTFDYKIQYAHILRLFLLPHKHNKQMYFVIALDPPIKQGQTRYPYLIVLFNNDDTISVSLTISDKVREKFGERVEKLDTQITGPYHEVVSRICRSLLDKRITVPGTFESVSGSKCLPCSYKANSGFLYPLERGFMYVHKPPLHILFQDIGSVKFSRSNQGHSKSFDFEIDHKNGTKHMFNGIEKTEQERLQEFVLSKQISIKKSDKGGKSGGGLKDMMDEDEDGHDAYAERMKAEGREKDEDDDDDESDDEDFNAGEEASDDDLEYDTDASISDSDDDENNGDKSKDKKKSIVKSKEKTSSPPKKKTNTSKEKSKGDVDKSKKSSDGGKEKSSKGSKKSADTKSDDLKVKSAEFVESGDESMSD